jgi:hypothetical protein
MNEERIRNVIRNTHNEVKYIIWADKKLNREEMLKQIRHLMYDTANIRPKRGTEIELEYNDNL